MEPPFHFPSEYSWKLNFVRLHDLYCSLVHIGSHKYLNALYTDEEPPEYDVKDRIVQLNAELANEPQPDNREIKVGFKEEIVDLVAPPPPDFSEEEDSRPNSARGEPQPLTAADRNNQAKTGSSEDLDKKQYVVERDGNFEVLSSNELSAEERAMYVQDEDKSGEKPDDLNQNNNSHSVKLVPKPPSRPRPNTATTASRRLRPATSPRPKSASHSSSSNSVVYNENYRSPYAISEDHKKQKEELLQKRSEEERAKEKRRIEEERKKKEDNDKAFWSWVEEKKKQKDEERRRQKENEKSGEEKVQYFFIFLSLWCQYCVHI